MFLKFCLFYVKKSWVQALQNKQALPNKTISPDLLIEKKSIPQTNEVIPIM